MNIRIITKVSMVKSIIFQPPKINSPDFSHISPMGPLPPSQLPTANYFFLSTQHSALSTLFRHCVQLFQQFRILVYQSCRGRICTGRMGQYKFYFFIHLESRVILLHP